MMDVRELLMGYDADLHAQERAKAEFAKLQAENLANFLIALASNLCDEQCPLSARQTAATYLVINLNEGCWMNVDSMSRNQITDMILKTLASPIFDIRCKAAWLISLVVLNDSEIHASKVITRLMKNLDASNNFLIHGSIKGLAAVCENVSSSSLDETLVEKVVKVAGECSGRLGYNLDSRIAAADALWAAVKFAKNESQKNILLKFLYDIVFMDCFRRLPLTTNEDKIDLKVAALESLITIGILYDRILESNVDMLVDCTHFLVKETNEFLDIIPANLVIEFWEMIAETEICIMNGELDWPSFYLIRRASPFLVPILQEASLIGREVSKKKWRLFEVN